MSILFEKVSQGPGIIGPSNSYLLHAGGSATVTVDVGPAAWVNTVLVDLLVERSDDGGENWNNESFAQIVGGSHSKDGSLPSQVINNPSNGDKSYRVTITLNSKLNIGWLWTPNA